MNSINDKLKIDIIKNVIHSQLNLPSDELKIEVDFIYYKDIVETIYLLFTLHTQCYPGAKSVSQTITQYDKKLSKFFSEFSITSQLRIVKLKNARRPEEMALKEINYSLDDETLNITFYHLIDFD